VEGFEPSISRATTWRLRPLGYTHHVSEYSYYRQKPAQFQRLLSCQLDYGNPSAAFSVNGGSVGFDQGVIVELFPDGLAQDARALAVDYPYLVEPSHEGVVEVFVEPGQGFVQSEVAQV
jgi:hypothetical protein